MGGKNHQPCSKYLPQSTKLSRSMSLASAELELANVALENIILAELNGEQRSRDDLMSHLQLSLASLREAGRVVGDLRHEMKANTYKDLPPLHELDLLEVGTQMAHQGLVELSSWEKMSEIMKQGTFFANLDFFGEMMSDLERKTTNLMMTFGRIKNRKLSEVAEENQSSNFKASFARLYTAWSSFHAHFLASSLLSTEVWYAFMDYGSLVRTKKVSV